MTPTPAGARIEIVQVLRFVAAAMVLMTHSTFYIHERMSSAFEVWYGGESGVPIFFVISGIVIVLTSSRLTNDSSGAVVFFERRIARIVPLYWLVTTLKVGLALALPSAVLHNHFDVVHALKSYFFIPAFNQEGQIRPIHGVGWTLLHEMYFYVLFTLAMFIRQRPIRVVTGVLIAACICGYLFEPKGAVAIVATSPINLHFVVGMWVGHLLLGSALPLGIRIGMPVLVGIALVLVAGLADWKLQLDPAALLIAAALPLLSSLSFPGFLRFFARLGDSSYSLYLFHPLIAAGIVAVFAKIGFSSPLLVLSVALVATTATAHLIHVVLETRLIALTRSFLQGLAVRIWPQGRQA
ncbi:acyltransferase family protein [Methyloversatilis sp.]|uniref:acyltransferase family protein n=1 Tax=Methyloversatilis sp. TaxID=2569862 RepID=UPI0035AE9E90